MRSFVEWLDDPECGFYLRKNWSAEKGWHSGGRLGLQPIQRRVFGHALTPDENGDLPYEVFVYSCPKKSGKTTLEAATAAWYGEEGDDFSEVYFIANSKEHARSLGFAMLSEHLTQRGMVQYKNDVTYDNGSSISVLATKYSTAAGGDPALSLWDELWAYETESHRRMWTEMTIPPTQRNPLKGVFTYAGYKATAVLLWELYESIVLEGEPVPELIDIVDDKGRPVCWRKGKMFAYWDTVPRMPWQTKEYYEKQAKTPGMRPQEFLRLHRNKWATTEDPFVPIDWWDDAVARGEKVGLICPVTYTPDSPFAKYPVTVAVDAAAKYDSTSLTAIYWDIQRGRVGLAYHKMWKPDPTGMFDFDKTVGAHIEGLKKKGLIIRQIVYDPRFLHQTMVRLKQKGYRVIEYAQSNKSLALASQALYDALQQGTFEAYPAPDLRKHLEYAQAKNTPQGFRIYKEKHAKYDDDGAISLAMGTYMAIESGGFDRGRSIRIEMPFGSRSKMKHIPKHKRKELEFLPEELRS